MSTPIFDELLREMAVSTESTQEKNTKATVAKAKTGKQVDSRHRAT